MKYLSVFLLISTLMVLTACDKMEGGHMHSKTEYDYHAHIITPDDKDKTRGETLPIRVEFESHAGEPVHHIQVRIYKKGATTDIYKKPDMAHIHDQSGKYIYEDNVVIDAANGFDTHDTYILEAKVWGENAGDGEAMETREFHVH